MTEHDLELSFVVPCHNEEGNLNPLTDAISAAMAPLDIPYEVIISDDCSTDNSWEILKKIAQVDSRIRVQRFKYKCGESAASWAGIQASRGRYIITLDADLQNDLSDLPMFLDALKRYDCVCGSRVTTRRKGDSFVCIVSSRIANWVRNKVLGENTSDSGCTYRAFRRACISKIRFFRGGHRFLPSLFKMEGFTVTEISVKNNPRFYGRSHYRTWSRLFNSFIDLWGMWWIKNRLIHYEIIEAIN